MIKKIIGIIIIMFLIIGFIEPIIAKNDSIFLEETSVLGYILDQSSTTFDNAAWGISGCFLTAQSFKPTMSPLVKVDIFCAYTGGEGNLQEPLEISIKSEIEGAELTSTAIYPSEIPYWTLDWVEIDFADIEVIPEETYYIVASCVNENKDSGKRYMWGCSGYDIDGYSRGYVFRTVCWIDEPIWDYYPEQNADCCFKTYTYGETPNVEILKINGGFRISVQIANTGEISATDVDWSIDLDDGLILAGGHSEGVIDELPPGETTTIRQTTLYGIGMTTITVTVDDVTKQATGFILGPLVLNVQEI